MNQPTDQRSLQRTNAPIRMKNLSHAQKYESALKKHSHFTTVVTFVHSLRLCPFPFSAAASDSAADDFGHDFQRKAQRKTRTLDGATGERHRPYRIARHHLRQLTVGNLKMRLRISQINTHDKYSIFERIELESPCRLDLKTLLQDLFNRDLILLVPFIKRLSIYKQYYVIQQSPSLVTSFLIDVWL